MGLRYEDLTLPQQEFAFYLLTITESGGIDSDIKWASTNYDIAYLGDPITVAPNSYTASEFALYGAYVRDNYPNLWAAWPQTWKDDIATHAWDDYFWEERYITYDENETYKAAVLNNLNDAKDSIVSFFFGDSPAGLKYWIDYMTDSLGVNTNDIKTLMYYFQICVLMPVTCMDVWNICGDAPLTTIRDCAIAYLRANNSDYYWDNYGDGWVNRFTKYAWDPIIAWDGVSAPPDFGVAEGVYPSSGAEPPNAVATVTGGGYDKAYLANGNQDLILVDAGGNKTLFRRANAGNVWISTKTTTVYTYEYNSNNPVSPGGEPSERPPVVVTGGWPYSSQLLSDLRAIEGTWEYDQGMHSYDPWQVQAGDCSSMVWWGTAKYDQTTADKMLFWDGTPGNTTIMQQTCSAIIQSGYNGDAIDTSLLLPGDLVLCNYYTTDSYMEGGRSGSHVAMWFAPGVMFHFVPSWGPTEITEADLTNAVLYWEVRRMPYGD